MIKSLGTNTDRTDVLAIPLGGQHSFLLIQGGNLNSPLVVPYSVLLKAIASSINLPAGSAAWGSIGSGTGVGSQADLVAYLNANYIDLSELASALANYVPTSRTITINGVTYDLSANRSWTISGGVTSVNGQTGVVVLALDDISNVNAPSPSVGQLLQWNGTEWIAATVGAAAWGSIGAGSGVGSQADLVAYLLANYQPLGSYVPTSRTITINGVTYDLSANRSWTIPSGGSPGGSNTQVQYNDGGAFGGDATFTFNETTKVVGVDSLQFNIVSPTTGPGAGLISYNGATGALAYKLNGSNVQSEIGETLHAFVHNAEAVTITKGQAVYLFQASGNKASVKLALNTSDATSAKTFGLAAEDIPAGNNGFVICQGVLDGLNTGMFSAGDTLYLGATAGSYTATKPYAPNHLVYIGIVERANAGNGQIYVRTQNGYELDEIHDVDLITTPPVNNDVLTYITGSPNLWKPRSVSSLVPSNLKTGSFGVTVDGVTTVVQIGQVGFVVIPYSGTITGWSITANAVGNIQFDVWKAAGAIPTIANTIVAGAFPTLTAGQFVTSATLTGWTTAFSAGDVFGFYVNSASTIKNATLTIRTTKS